MASNKNERTNGIKCPLSCQQVGIWINTATTIASSVAWLMIPLAEDIFREGDKRTQDYVNIIIFVTLIAAFVIGFIFMTILGIKCTLANPTDLLIQKQRLFKH